jgi:anti-sigma-K factor RskA
MPPVLVSCQAVSFATNETVTSTPLVLVVLNTTALIQQSVTWDAKEHHLHIAPGLLFNPYPANVENMVSSL